MCPQPHSGKGRTTVVDTGRDPARPMPNSNQPLTIREVAAILRIGEKVVYSEIHNGRLGAFRAGKKNFRITQSALEEYQHRRDNPEHYADHIPEAPRRRRGVVS